MMRAIVFVFAAAVAQAAPRPNLVLVLFDDLGYEQPRSYDPRSKFVTPNLDRLAREGMRFTDAHAAASICTPTRYGLVTGQYPWRRGQYDAVDHFCPPIIPAERATVATVLKAAGYQTAIVGKWHLGANFHADKKSLESIGTKCSDGPLARGFTSCAFFTDARSMGTVVVGEQVAAHLEPAEVQPWLAEKALRFVADRKQDRQPFFLFLALAAPHVPFVPSPQYRGKTGQGDEADWLLAGDAVLGEVLDALERSGLAKNTLVVATSDNGRPAGSHGLRGAKGDIWEAGHRVPFIARWPGKIPAGAVQRAPLSLNDWFATAAELAGAPIPDGAAEDSVSQVPALLDGKSPRRELVVQSGDEDLALLSQPWKLIVRKDGTRELYNLDKDLMETKDLAAREPAVVARLMALLEKQIDDGRSTPGKPQPPAVTPPWHHPKR
jgi:arylsulfatase A-like enzyme